MSARAEELARLRRPFVVGVVVVLALFVAVGVVVKIADQKHRAPGIAERWLDAVSDTTRSGVEADGRKRAQSLGPDVPYSFLWSAKPDGKAAFDDLEVGRAQAATSDRVGCPAGVECTRVPFEVHQHNGHAVTGTLVLRRNGDSWLVAAVDSRQPGELVPSQGGPPASSVGALAWVLWGAAGVALAVITSTLVGWAGRTSP